MSDVTPEYEEYETPMELAEDASLSMDRKKTLLQKWYEDELALIRAAEEGLDGGEASQLNDVTKAFDMLGLEPAQRQAS